MLLQRPAPAKINLGLHILRKRPDGFHDLETVFLAIPWADHLTARPAPTPSPTCPDPALPTDEHNLCFRAARVLADHTATPYGAALHLDKHIPYGAGLGGGSSDAANTLRLLTECWDLDVPEADLHMLAATLGSDVPFFLGSEAAFATGRGEILTPLRDPHIGAAYIFPFVLVVIAPAVHVSTAEAYGMIRPHDHNRPDLRALVCANNLARWRDALVNDFEGPIFEAHPVLGTLKAGLLEAGAGYAAMSGSGSALFGVFEDAHAAQAAAEAARRAGHRVWWGRVV